MNNVNWNDFEAVIKVIETKTKDAIDNLDGVAEKLSFLKDAPKSLLSNREFMLMAVNKSCGLVIKFAAENLWQDTEIALAAVSAGGCALEYVCDAFKADRNIVLTAVQDNGYALKFAAD